MLLLCFALPPLLLRVELCIIYVAEHLHAPGKHLRSDHAVILIDRQTVNPHEPSGIFAVLAEIDQQAPFLVEDLDPVLRRVCDPDMAVTIDCNPFWALKVLRTVAVLTKGADEAAIGVENLDSIVERVSDIDIAIMIHGG